MVGGGGGEVQKNIHARGNQMKKYSCIPINHKKYSCYGLKKNSYKEFDKEKKFLRLKNSPPTPHPHNFTNGLHLRADNPTHPLLNPSFFFFFSPGFPTVLSLEKADNMYIKLIIYHIFLDPITHLF